MGGRGGLSHFHEMEILYRLSRMRTRYPTVVTPDSYDTMRTAIETGEGEDEEKLLVGWKA